MSVQVYYELVKVEGWAGVRSWALRTHHWFYGLFKSAPDLIALLLPVRGTKWTAKRILSCQLTDLVSRWSNVPPLLRPTCRAGRPRVINCLLVKGQAGGELFWGVILETEAYSKVVRRTQLYLCCAPIPSRT